MTARPSPTAAVQAFDETPVFGAVDGHGGVTGRVFWFWLPGENLDLDQRLTHVLAACMFAVGLGSAGRCRQPSRDARKMEVVRIARTIMAVLVAIAVAAMPAAAGVMAAAGPKADASAAMAHAGDMPADCAHHHAPADRGQKGSDDGAAMAACAVHCFTYVGTVVPGIAMTLTSSRLQPLASAGRIASSLAAPPFRPPRI